MLAARLSNARLFSQASPGTSSRMRVNLRPFGFDETGNSSKSAWSAGSNRSGSNELLLGGRAEDRADADDPDRALAVDDREMAEAVVEHDLRRLVRRDVRANGDRVRRHPGAHALLRGVRSRSDRAHHVAV